MTDYRARIRNLDATYTELQVSQSSDQERRLQLEKNWNLRRNYEKSYYEVRATQIQEELIDIEKEREKTRQRNDKIIAEMDNMRTQQQVGKQSQLDSQQETEGGKGDRTDPRWKEKVYNRKTHELAVLEAKKRQIQALPNNAALRSVDLEIARLKQMLEGRGFVPTTVSDRERTSRKSERVMSGDQEVKRIVDSIPKPQIYSGNEEEERRQEQIERIQSRPQAAMLKKGPAFLYKEEEPEGGRLSEIQQELRLSGFDEPPKKEKISSQGRDTPPRAPLSNPRKGSLGKEESKSEYEKMLELREATLARERRDSEERRQQRLADERRQKQIEDERKKKLEDDKRRERELEDERIRQKALQDERRRLADQKRRIQQLQLEAREREQREQEAREERERAKLKEMSDIERTKAERRGSERDELKQMELEIEGDLGEDEGDSGDLDWQNMFDSKLQREARLTRVGGRIQRQQMGGENITEQLKDAESYLRLISHKDKLTALQIAGDQIERCGKGIVYDLEMHEDRELAAEQREMEYIRQFRKTSEGVSLVRLGNLCMNICKEGYEEKMKNQDLIATSAQLMSTFQNEFILEIFLQFSQHLSHCVTKRLVAQKDVADILLWAFSRTMDQETRSDIRYIFNCYIEDELLPKLEPKKVVVTSPSKIEKKEEEKVETEKKLPQAQGGLDVSDEDEDDEDIDGDEFMDSWIEQNENFS